MTQKYYLDTCIWRDYFENRSDRFRPLGDWAFTLLSNIVQNEDLVLYSDLTIQELNKDLNHKKIKEALSIVPEQLLIKVNVLPIQFKEAISLSRKHKIPANDALHYILAKDNNAILVTRDKHFYELNDKMMIKKPEDLI
ncbi:MAG: PIN domain-containing protein [Candidatus Woesearchaeota archaeon]